MGLKWRTQTRTNGDKAREARDFVIGLDLIIPFASLVGYLIAQRVTLGNQITALETQQAELPAIIAKQFSELQRSESYVTRAEWLTDKQTQDKVIADGLERHDRKLDKLLDGQAYARMVLGKLPPLKRDDEEERR